MKTILSLRKKLKECAERLDTLSKSIYTFTDVIKAKKEFREANAKYLKTIRKADKKIEEKMIEIGKEQLKYFAELNLLQEKQENSVPQLVRDFIKSISRGVDWGKKGFVFKWISPNNRFVILSNPGSNFSTGREQEYGCTTHYLFDLNNYDVRESDGWTLCCQCKVLEIDGRINKKTLAEWKEMATKKEQITKE